MKVSNAHVKILRKLSISKILLAVFIFNGVWFVLFLFSAPQEKSDSSPQHVKQKDIDSDLNSDDQRKNKVVRLDNRIKAAYRFERYKNRNVPQSGPGELGDSVILTGKEQELGASLFKKEAFNIIASNKISLSRTLRDTRDHLCREVKYPEALPSASVIIIFHNEAWSPLLRTAHSVVNRSPPQYLHEVILLDDFSYRPELGANLTKYVAETWLDGVVKIVRTKERSGLIRARLRGAEAASGDVLIFLDSHCEAGEGWLEPLLARIKEQPNSVLCPEIDIIDAQTLSYGGTGSESVGSFWWSLHFSWKSIPQKERQRRKSSIDPIRSPTMAGGLFAVGRKFFFDIGGYDPGMDVWGGENLEISFRSWMCGGILEFIPCSRVGHIFRASHPYTFPGNKDTHGLNSMRLAEVWMDDYKRLFYMHRHDLKENHMSDMGDISERVTLRKRLKCKSFKWYLDNVADKFIPDEDVLAYGMVRNPSTQLCLDTMGQDEKYSMNLAVFNCQSGASANQVLSLSYANQLRREEACAEAISGENGENVVLRSCDPSADSRFQIWTYDQSKKQLIHKSSGKCLDTTGKAASSHVFLFDCGAPGHLTGQEWTFEHFLGTPTVDVRKGS